MFPRSGRRRDRRDPPIRCRPPSPRQTPPCRPDRKPHTHSGRGGCSLLLTLELLFAVSEEGVRRAVARQSFVASVTSALAALRTAGSGERLDQRSAWPVLLWYCEPGASSEIHPLARILAVLCTAVAETPERIDDDIWWWTARHPEWHPAGFGDEVACFALKTDAELLLIDPLLPADPAPIHELVDAEAGEHGIAVLVTIPYHVRDAERLRRKHGSRCTIWGHEACASRLAKRTGFHAITP